jgi:cell division protein FtsI (penicillin-binding protein 3)
MDEAIEHAHPVRHYLMLALLGLGLCALGGRVAYLQVSDGAYLKAQGQARHLRVMKTPPTRGLILDRNGETLAVSTPVDSVWAHPQTLLAEGRSFEALARLLGMREGEIKELCLKNAEREFVYLKRHLAPQDARKVMDLRVPGVELERGYRRYYPLGPVFGQVVGFTNAEDAGQEGVELAFNQPLAGQPGKARVLRDRVGHTVERVEGIQPTQHGSNLRLSLDARLQYLAYRQLAAAVKQHRAAGGTFVLLDAKNGELLAMVNEPDFNPNNLADREGDKFRNRAVTDTFEPGSTLKPFTLAMALERGAVTPDSRVDTSPGTLQIGNHTIRDGHDYGLLTAARVIVKSSNVGAAKIALAQPVTALIETLARFGYGQQTGSGLPGEVDGRLPSRAKWQPIEHATLAFGYGMATTPLQLARAYQALANDGALLPIAIQPVDKTPAAERVLRANTVRQMRAMLEAATGDEGTGGQARVPQYRVAGKTGTVHRLIGGRYAPDRYLSVFAGMAPASDPRLVAVVVINDPRGEQHFGGLVAAPVFSKVMAGALRILNVPPDGPLPATEAQGVETGRT